MTEEDVRRREDVCALVVSLLERPLVVCLALGKLGRRTRWSATLRTFHAGHRSPHGADVSLSRVLVLPFLKNRRLDIFDTVSDGNETSPIPPTSMHAPQKDDKSCGNKQPITVR